MADANRGFIWTRTGRGEWLVERPEVAAERRDREAYLAWFARQSRNSPLWLQRRVPQESLINAIFGVGFWH
jgi:hypothetical protein